MHLKVELYISLRNEQRADVDLEYAVLSWWFRILPCFALPRPTVSQEIIDGSYDVIEDLIEELGTFNTVRNVTRTRHALIRSESGAFFPAGCGQRYTRRKINPPPLQLLARS